MKTKHYLTSVLLTLLFFSCVPKKKFIALQSENTNLAQTITRLKADSTALQKRIDAMNRQSQQTITVAPPVVTHNPTTISQDEIYKFKANYIYNFTKNITWPNKLEGSFNIAVLKSNSMYEKLLAKYAGQQVANIPVKVSLASSVDEVKSANLVFIPLSQSGNFDNVASRCSKKSTILITENDSFTSLKCNCINLTMDGNNVKYQIDEKTMRNNGFGVAMSLIQLENK